MTPDQVMKQFTMGGFLRNAKKKLGDIGEQALYTATVETPDLIRTAGEQASGLGAARTMAKMLRGKDTQAEAPAEMTERKGYGTPQSDPGTMIAGSVLGDPLNLVAGAPAAGRVLKAGVERFALPKLESMAAAHIVPPLPSTARRAGQQTLPGVEPLTRAQEKEAARQRLIAKTEDASFDTMTGMGERNETDWVYNRGENTFYRTPVDMRESRSGRTLHPVGSTEHGADENAQILMRENPAAYERARATQEGVAATQDEINALALEQANDDADRANALIAQLRGRRSPNKDLEDSLNLEREIYNAKRSVPLRGYAEGDVWRADPDSSRMVLNARGEALDPHQAINYFDPDSQTAIRNVMAQRRAVGEAREAVEDIDPIVEALRAERAGPEGVVPPAVRELTDTPLGRSLQHGFGSEPAGKEWWMKELGVEPGAAAERFLKEAQTNPELFTYGLAPPRGVDIAEHYTAEAQDAYRRGLLRKRPSEVRIDEATGDYDDYEPKKIEVPKEHEYGDWPMRDRYGDYKLAEAEEGQKLKDEYGDLKKIEKDKELMGPPPEGESELWGTKKVPKRAEGGEYYRDESGEYVYRKAEGGEPVRDERGRQKYRKEENPDYRGEPDDEMRFYLEDDPSQYISWVPGEQPGATSVEKGGERGSLLYQVMNSYALRNGMDIPSGGYTVSNAYRMLPNSLSTYARHGEQPRNLRGLEHGAEPSVRGQPPGWEIMRAYAGATEARVPETKRVTFDGKRFLVDGNPTEPALLGEAIGIGKTRAGVGQKSIMARALYRYLEQADAAEGARLAKEWSKKLGPVFSGVFAAPDINELLTKENDNGAGR